MYNYRTYIPYTYFVYTSIWDILVSDYVSISTFRWFNHLNLLHPYWFGVYFLSAAEGGLWKFASWRTLFFLEYFFKDCIYLFRRESMSGGKGRVWGRSRLSLCRELDVRLHQRSLGSWPELKADAYLTEPPRCSSTCRLVKHSFIGLTSK